MKGRLTFLQLQEKRALTLFTGKWVMGFYLGLPLVLRPEISLSAVVGCVQGRQKWGKGGVFM